MDTEGALARTVVIAVVVIALFFALLTVERTALYGVLSPYRDELARASSARPLDVGNLRAAIGRADAQGITGEEMNGARGLLQRCEHVEARVRSAIATAQAARD